jgi:hypothetical protein
VTGAEAGKNSEINHNQAGMCLLNIKTLINFCSNENSNTENLGQVQ